MNGFYMKATLASNGLKSFVMWWQLIIEWNYSYFVGIGTSLGKY